MKAVEELQDTKIDVAANPKKRASRPMVMSVKLAWYMVSNRLRGQEALPIWLPCWNPWKCATWLASDAAASTNTSL